MSASKNTLIVINSLLFCLSPTLSNAAEPGCPNSDAPNSQVLFCDSFETPGANETSINTQAYFDFNDDDGDLQRTASEAAHGNHAMRVQWQTGEDEAGAFFINFGRSPLTSNISSSNDFREIYWRWYVKYPENFQSYPDKMTRITSFANANWAQAMAAHIWADSAGNANLALDPVSGIKDNQLVTTRWNDQGSFTWLGLVKSQQDFPKGRWVCVEAHIKLNDANQTNGLFELFIDDQLDITKSDINWVGNWNDYALNSIHFSNYWNGGAPANQQRFLDAIVVSTAKIGCIAPEKRPNPPEDVLSN
ncbi:polysaccharide lyase [Aliikangiella sp. IMCC44653]